MSLGGILFLGLLLFCLGMVGLLSRRNPIMMLIGVELMMIAAGLNFLAFSSFVGANPAVGQTAVLLIVGLAAGEAGIFLSLLLVMYRTRQHIDVEDLTEVRG